MKTDLAKTLSVRGQHGLFNYIAQSRTGAIAESLTSLGHPTYFEQIAKVELSLKDNELDYAIELVGPESNATSDSICTCGGITEEQIAGLLFQAYKDFEKRRHFRLSDAEAAKLPI